MVQEPEANFALAKAHGNVEDAEHRSNSRHDEDDDRDGHGQIHAFVSTDSQGILAAADVVDCTSGRRGGRRRVRWIRW